MNKDSEYSGRDESKTWTFIDSVLDSCRNNTAAFGVGFLFTVVLIMVFILADPQDKIGFHDYVEKTQREKGDSYQEMDKPLGYQNMLKRKKEEHPELYEA